MNILPLEMQRKKIDMEVIYKTEWHAELHMVETTLSGTVNEQDIEQWEQSLTQAFARIPDGTYFKIFINLHGFSAATLQAHKRYREIIPLLLANHDWKVGYVDLFEESKLMKFRKIRNIGCIAAVHVHQDEEKIKKYEENFSRENEHYMTDPVKAKQWILSYPLN